MDTIKTAFIVVLLLGVLYGVYVILNKDNQAGVAESGWAADQPMEPPAFEIGGPDGADFANGGGPIVPPSGSAWSPGAPAAEPSTAADGSWSPDSPAPPLNGYSQPGGTPLQPPKPPTNFGAPNDPSSPTDRGVNAGGPFGAFPVEPAAPYGQQFSEPPRPNGSNGPAVEPDQKQPARGPTENQFAENPDRNAPYASDQVDGTGGAPPIEPITPYAPKAPYSDNTSGNAARIAAPPNQAGAGSGDSPFAQVKEAAEQQTQAGDFRGALETLSALFGNPQLTADEQRQLLDHLDPLAGKVIYSTEHLLEPGYTIQRGERLVDIASRYNIPVQLLRNINGVQNPDALTLGDTLKVLRGPFRAEIRLGQQELVLFLDKLYAGRFPITLGGEPAPVPGEYMVKGKERGKSYYGHQGQVFDANHPSNPFGGWWLDLGRDFSIHGTAATGDNRGLGCVSLSPVDAGDVYGILSAGSKVTIRR